MYSIIDIEGNGAAYRKESIIEIAIYRYNGHEVTDQFFSLVDPESEITPFVQKLTGITQKMVKTAPKFHEIAKRVIEITEGTTMVGHNVEFDYRMVRQSFKRLGYDFEMETLDTIALSRQIFPNEPSYSLGKLCQSLGVPHVDHHRAAGDARATLELFKVLMNKDTDKTILQKHHEENNAKNYLSKLKDLTEELPTEKGIIYFQDETGKILHSEYVEDLYRFARRTFQAKSQRWQQIQQNTTQINYELTGNDLIAALMLINSKTYKNRRLPFGVFWKNGRYVIARWGKEEEKPLLKIKSYTQGSKVAKYLEKNEDLNLPERLNAFLNLKKRNEIWISSGRRLGEKSFLLLQNGKVKGFGFFELFNQINTLEKLLRNMVEVPALKNELDDYLKLSLLRNEFEILPLPH